MTLHAFLQPGEVQSLLGMPSTSMWRALSLGELPALCLPRGSRKLYRVPAAELGLDAPHPLDQVTRVMTTRSVAKLVRVHHRTVEKWASAGMLPMARVARRWRMSAPEFVQWLKRHSVEAQGKTSTRWLHPSNRTPPEAIEAPPDDAAPIPIDLDGMSVPARWFACPAYDRCLRRVARDGWDSWDCSACPLCPEGIEATPLRALPIVATDPIAIDRQHAVLASMRGDR